jgi:hypothetical protein
MVRVSRTLSAVAVFILCHLQGISLCNGENLPDAVKRQEEEIESLRDQIKTLTDSLESLRQGQSSSAPIQLNPSCKKDTFKADYSEAQLRSEININNTGITFKRVKSDTSANPSYIIVASNVSELNAIPLKVNFRYAFLFQGCHFVLHVLAVVPGSPSAFSLLLESS